MIEKKTLHLYAYWIHKIVQTEWLKGTEKENIIFQPLRYYLLNENRHFDDASFSSVSRK